jgi:hypothetical protein
VAHFFLNRHITGLGSGTGRSRFGDGGNGSGKFVHRRFEEGDAVCVGELLSLEVLECSGGAGCDRARH